MASETKSNALSPLTSDFTSISIDATESQSQLELPEHDEHFIHYGDKTYKRGKACPVK